MDCPGTGVGTPGVHKMLGGWRGEAVLDDVMYVGVQLYQDVVCNSWIHQYNLSSFSCLVCFQFNKILMTILSLIALYFMQPRLNQLNIFSFKC